MELEHRFTVAASAERTWQALNDLEEVALCFPGAVLTSMEGEEFSGSAKIKLGPIALQYTGTGRFIERDEAARRAVLEAKGKDRRGNGTASATVTAVLSQVGPAETAVDVHTDLAVTGKPAQFGRGVMQDVSDKLLQQFVECLQGKLADQPERGGADQPEQNGAQAEPPEQGGEHSEPAEQRAAQADKRVQGAADAAMAANAVGSGAVAGSGPPESPQGTGSARPGAELDLLGAVLPVLLKRYGPYLLGAVAVVVAARRVARRD